MSPDANASPSGMLMEWKEGLEEEREGGRGRRRRKSEEGRRGGTCVKDARSKWQAT